MNYKGIVFLVGLLIIAAIAWLTLKLSGGQQRFGSLYYTVRSWIVLISLILIGLTANTHYFAFGIIFLTVLMIAKGQHEIRRLFRTYPSVTQHQKWLDGFFVGVFTLF